MAVTACVAIMAAHASAQGPAIKASGDKQDQEVVVTAKRLDLSTVATQARHITRTVEDEVPRFENSVCPLVVGLPSAYDRVIEQRIRAVAGMAHIRSDRDRCTPNLLVVISDEPSALLDTLNRKRSTLFETLPLHDLERLLRSGGPSWSWQTTEPKRRDGAPVEHISQVDLGNGPQPVQRGAYIAHNVQMSRLTVPVRQDIIKSYVVINLQASDKLTLTQIGDYVAVLGLAPIDPSAGGRITSPSILRLFADNGNGGSVETGATAFDIGYLTGLYAGQAGLSASRKVNDIAWRIAR